MTRNARDDEDFELNIKHKRNIITLNTELYG